MKKEIRKDVREYILSQVNETLARLGVSEKVVETKEFEAKYQDTLHYEFQSAPIRQMPMMFKKLVVDGYMVSVEITKEDDRFFKAYEKRDVVVVNMDYRYNHFRGGSNGCELGRMIFLVERELPENFESEYFENTADLYIRKVEGLSI